MHKKIHLSLFVVLAAVLAAGNALAGTALDPASRIALSRSAAERARLHEVGLDFRDVYGVINAETSWVPRTGMGKNGVASHGLAQFEPATARAVGLRDPNNPVEAVHAAARLLREAAVWSKQRVARLSLAPEQKAAKLREGISIYYNLSSRARATWSGLNTQALPVETLRHIRNVREGAKQADQLNARFGGASLPPLPADDAVQTAVLGGRAATARAKPSTPQALGTMEWSRTGEGRRSYVVFSDGTVKPDAGKSPAGAIHFTQRAKE
ncbi:MAG TPA: hypothetical protein VF522_20225 [Ramlibacter sp.]|uniref:hypothetical protein n=1 Tax=Ramlibacter sp. TaxID=1917967 RepID=UPI002ED197E9